MSSQLIDLSQPTLYFAIAHILFNPVFWNIVARAEYKTKILTKLAGGDPYKGTYFLAATIFTLGLTRDYLYHKALAYQPTHPIFDEYIVQISAGLLFVTGNVLVLSSMWALGVTGTYLGDYFGILMKQRVTGFPFNVCDNPMYVGSTCTFLATALWYKSPAGIALTCLVYLLYKVALTFEEPFTAMIYANKDKKK
ncbi:phospholipid methyltransferase-domain-containing protein [Mycotypha africana]|uniref:phospholipid methyltransferase-domain-containing protein n=1 Tax=Mycotypha africana TaxID=64632 RepID=UPI002301609E|nr:phospholipid methyltransferase-domain-containing protein [Mycotypha africana]KAI8970102.1 phospholipid methyltransferase-domain-containing protein [Mycotypha africana]